MTIAPLVTIYTDGACIGNPGPGGYGAVLFYGDKRRELSGAYRATTNNRMELLACIMALEALKTRCAVTLWTDSMYVHNGIEKGWAVRWRANGWHTGPKKPAVNPDLWGRLLDLCAAHQVTMRWVKGHNGDPGNERANDLAERAARSGPFQIDEPYERGVRDRTTRNLWPVVEG